MADKWRKRWIVNSRTDYDKSYTVSMDTKGKFGCSCPKWKFQRGERQDCHHIKAIKQNLFINLMATTIAGGCVETHQDWYKYEIKEIEREEG